MTDTTISIKCSAASYTGLGRMILFRNINLKKAMIVTEILFHYKKQLGLLFCFRITMTMYNV